MKIICHRKHGTALLAVVVLLAFMITITMSNTRRLILLKREIQLIDQRQQRKFLKNAPTPIRQEPEKRTQ